MILDIIFLILGFSFYTFYFYSFTKKSKTVFFIITSGLIILHDFLFIYIDKYVSEKILYILKSWQEYLFCFLLYLFLKNARKIDKQSLRMLFILIFLTIFAGIISLINGDKLIDIFLSWRMYLLPIFFSLLIYLNDGFKGIKINLFYQILQFFLLIIVVVAIYQHFMFRYSGGENIVFMSKNFRHSATNALSNTFWFFDYFGSDYLLPRWFNYVRNNNIRATGLFVSPIIFAQFLGILGSFMLAKTFLSKKKNISIIMLCICLYGIYLSQVRIGYLYIIVSFLITFFSKKLGVKKYLIYGIPYLLVFITFIGLSVFKVGDASSLGRLTQYGRMISEFRFLGFGLGSKNAIISFDSLIISGVFAFGVFSLLYFKLHSIIINKIRVYNPTISSSFFKIGLLGCTSSMIYTVFFHYSVGAAPIRFIYFLLFYYLYQIKIYEKA